MSTPEIGQHRTLYQRRQQMTDDPAKQCNRANCRRVITARGMCSQHYYRWRSLQPAGPNCKKCSEPECVLPVWSLGRCRTHDRKFKHQQKRNEVQK